MSFKYLSDGRKIAVIGQLNNTETIVQEIFVTEQGDEIPSGEKFTTKSLHDSYVTSWADRKKEALEKELEDLTQQVQDMKETVRSTKTAMRDTVEYYKNIFRDVKVLSENIQGYDFEVLTSVMAGDDSLWVTDGFKAPKPLFDSLRYTEDDRRGVCCTLLSLFGYSGGNLSYRIHTHPDGSGTYKPIFWDDAKIFKTREDAIQYVKECLEKKSDTPNFYAPRAKEFLRLALELGIELSQDTKQKLVPMAVEDIKEELEAESKRLKDSIKVLEERLEKGNKELKEFEKYLSGSSE